MLIKICGITRLEDARCAVDAGATALGFVFWPSSPRYIEPDAAAEIVAAVPRDVTTVGVFVNLPVALVRRAVEASGVGVVQLHGDESPLYAGLLRRPIFRSLTLDDAEAAAGWPGETTFVLDAADRVKRGGTGTLVDHTRAADVARRYRVVLAGGLTPENVAGAIATVRPCGVDVSSGVEAAPGVKEPAKVERFVAAARQAFQRIES